ncbi:hypothetical protein, partial [Hoeflea sp.]|uniref:hypothetical protein n=1 Tax=Hoeflea sp. TaxID=1940281 RepID=UPI0025C09CA2
EVLTTVALVALVIGIIGLVVAASYLRLTMPPGDRMDRLYRAGTSLNRLILLLGPVLFLAVVAYVKLYQVTG